MTRNAKAALILILGVLTLPSIARAAGSAAEVSLSSQAATRAEAVSPPMISAPSNVNAIADQPLTIQADATDPDAADILTITQSGAPASLTLNHTPSVSPAMAALTGTPGGGDVGSYSIEWQVSDGTFMAATTTMLNVAANNDPTITAPPTALTAETAELSFFVTASDPDGDALTSLTTGPLPPGATFNPNALNTSGSLDWTPTVGQAGDYSVTFTVTSGSPSRSASATTPIHVNTLDRPPVVTFPGSVTTIPGALLTINITVTDPDGDTINTLEALGTQNTPLPPGAVFTKNANNTAGTLTWTPNSSQIGNYGVQWIATSGALDLPCPLSVTRIVVRDRAPVVTAPSTITGPEGALLTFNVSASDPDGSPISSLTAAPLPFGATFSANAAHTSGTLTWTPDYSSAGSYPVVFTATNALSGSATTNIVITNTNQTPMANAGGPYTGVAGVSLSFNGSASSDPDGDPLTYAWNFGDSNTGVGATPNHTYSSGGAFAVSLTVTDTGSPALSNTANTTATIADVFDARAFTTNSNKSIRLNSNKPQWCAEIEPLDGDFGLSEVVPSSIILVFGGNQISAEAGKTAVVSDQDKNGVDELEVCFSKSDLRTLFASLAGHSTVTVMIQGSLMSGAKINAPLDVDVVTSGGTLSATVSPNPFNPEGTLSFSTKQAGPLRVRLYDLNGRLVRTLANESFASAGYHDVHMDGRGESGAKLASGVYFYKLETADGSIVGSVSILK